MRSVFCIACVCAWSVRLASAPFINLDFELANTNNLSGGIFNPTPPFSAGFGTTADLLPGWSLRHGQSTVTRIGVDTVLAGDGYASLYTPQMPLGAVQIRVESKFSFAMWPVLTYSLGQTGDIPAGSQFIRFGGSGGALALSINGTNIPLSLVFDSMLQSSRVGDISAFSGQTAELVFATAEQPGGFRHFVIDSISFEVPEPKPVILIALGMACVLARAWHNRLSRR